LHNLKKFLDRQGIHYTTKDRKDTLVFKLLEYKKSEDLAKKSEELAKKNQKNNFKIKQLHNLKKC